VPFTLAHPIAVAPLWYGSRRRLDLAGLIVGSMIPDLPYYLHLRPVRTWAPTPSDFFLLALPSALLIVLAWRLLIRKPVFHLLQGRPPPSPRRGSVAAGLPLLVVAILLGAATHWLWDAMSHANGWFVQRTDWMTQQVLGLPVFKWIQYGCGVLGCTAVLYWWVRERSATGPATVSVPMDARARLIVWTMAGVTVLAFIIAANLMHGEEHFSVHRLLVQSSIGVVSGLAVWGLVYGTIYSGRGWANKG